MKLFISPLILCITLGCTKNETKLSDSCIEIIESDSFYYALPLPLNEVNYKEMYRIENYITDVTNSEAQTIDFDCAIVVNPSEEQIRTLQKTMPEEDFTESFRISANHSEAVRCMIESKGIRTIEATGQFIRFVSEKQSWNLDVRKDSIPDWIYILFKEGKNPLVLPSLTFTVEDIDQYFHVSN